MQLVEIEKRDKGSILEPQLSWLKSDLAKTEKEKIIIFSDHPLIAYAGKRKNYEIVNQEQVSQILENSGVGFILTVTRSPSRLRYVLPSCNFILSPR